MKRTYIFNCTLNCSGNKLKGGKCGRDEIGYGCKTSGGKWWPLNQSRNNWRDSPSGGREAKSRLWHVMDLGDGKNMSRSKAPGGS